MSLLYGIMSYWIMDNTDCSTDFTTNLKADSPLGLSYYYSGIQSCTANHYWMGVRNHYVIHFVLDGFGKCFYDGEECKLGKGKAFIIRPRQKIHYIADSVSPWRYCWIAFNGVNSSSLLKETAFSSGHPTADFKNPDAIENKINRLSSLRPSTGNNYLHEISSLLDILSNIEPRPEISGNKADSKKRYVNIALNFIDRNYSGNITVESISKHVGLNRKYLSSVFNAVLGVSTQQYLLSKRMREATILLTDSDLSVKEIAHSVGYYDALLFSKMFKKKYGLSPIKFRNRSAPE